SGRCDQTTALPYGRGPWIWENALISPLTMADDRKHFLEGKSIVVAGGGIAGSAFAVAIRRLWDPSLRPPTIVILERDSEDVSQQREGYSLSLAGHDNTGGLAALKKLGLLDDVVGRAVSG